MNPKLSLTLNGTQKHTIGAYNVLTEVLLVDFLGFLIKNGIFLWF